jgi:signal transduction histidine kinase
MQERASALGGAFVIESQSGSGASVTVTIPTETLAAEEV